MKNIKVSIIIPVYNTEKYLKKCLDSLINQTLDNLEIICIDDGSTDNSLEILENYSKKYSNVLVICEKHRGAGAARNSGLKIANGEYIAFVDSDDWVRKNSFEILYNSAKLNNTDILMFKLINYSQDNDDFYEDSVYNLESLKNFWNGQIFNHDSVRDVLFTISTATVNKLYKKTFLRNIDSKFPEGLIFEDNAFFFNNFLNAERVMIIDECFYFRRRHKKSVMGVGGKKYLDIIPMVDIIFDIFKSNNEFEKYKKFLHNFKVKTFHSYYNLINNDYKPDFYESAKKNLLKYETTINDFEFLLNSENSNFYNNIIQSKTFQEFILLKKIQNLDNQISNYKKIIKNQKNGINRYKNSHSWKITKPFRVLTNNFKKIFLKSPFLFILKNSKNLKKAFLEYKGYIKIKNSKFFDEKFYKENYNYSSALNPIIHYIHNGYKKGYKPSMDFDGEYYINKYSDVKKLNINPLSYHVLFGEKKGNYKNIFEDIKNSLKSFNKEEKTKKRILYVLHAFGGGTSQTNEDLMKYVQKDYDCYILSRSNQNVLLWEYKNNEVQLINSWRVNFRWNVTKIFDSELNDIYFNILSSLNLDIVHIRHLIYHTFDLPKVIHRLNIPLVLSFHDFYFICPSYCLLDSNNCYCEGICLANNVKCVSFNNMGSLDNLKNFILIWRKEVFKMFEYVDSFITTSKIVKNLFASVYPKMNVENFNVIEHGRDFIKTNEEFSEEPDENKPIKILFIGALDEHKGTNLIKDIKKLDHHSKLEFHFLGRIPGELLDFGEYHGSYERKDLGNKIKEIKPSFIGIFSIWPETYCHTLTEAWNYNIPVISTKIGVLYDRVSQNNGGFFIDHKNPEISYKTILDISKNIEEYMLIKNNIKNISIKSAEEMANEYIDIYKKLL